MHDENDIKKQLSELNKMSKKSVALYHRFALCVGVSDSALGVLYALSEAKTPCSQNDLCGDWYIPKQTINSAITTLQKKGLVSLSPVPGARNKKNIALTRSGAAFAEKTVDVLRDAELGTLATFSPEERELYVRLNKEYNQRLTENLRGFVTKRAKDEEDRT